MIKILRRMEARMSSASNESVRLLDYYRALLQQLSTKAQIADVGANKAVGITSCAEGEGVSTICSNLAIVAAQDLKKRVLVIDANVQQPQTSRLFGMQAGPGLTDIIGTERPVEDVIQATGTPDVFLLPAGTPVRKGFDASRIAIHELLVRLREQFGFILVDLPVATDLSGCFKTAAVLDGVILVVEAERVRSHVIRRAKEQLEQNQANLLGVVFNKRRQHVPGWLYRRI